MTQRIEFLSFCQKKKNDSKNWAFPRNTIQRTELLFNMTQRFFSIWLEELNPSLYHDSKTWFFFTKKKLKEFFFKTHRLEPFKKYFLKKKNDSKNWFFLNFIHRIEHLFRTQVTELNALFNMTHRNWTPFFNMTHRNWTHFFERDPVWNNDSKNWTLLLFSTMTQKIELFVNDSFNWASFMNLFSIRVELLFLSDSKNWTFFQYDSKDFEYFSKIGTLFEYDSKNRPFFNTTQKIEIFGWQKIELFPMNYDSKNWTFFLPKCAKFF